MAALLGIGECSQDRGSLGRKSGRLSQLRVGGHKVALRKRQPSEIEERAGKLVIEGGRSLEFALGEGGLVCVLIGETEVIVRRDKFRIEDDRFLEVLDCLLRVAGPGRGRGLVEFVDGFGGAARSSCDSAPESTAHCGDPFPAGWCAGSAG